MVLVTLLAHTFFMSRSKYGKKVIKTIVYHRTCRTCQWWKTHRPGTPVRSHRCVKNHVGSAKLMEPLSGVQGMKELIEEGTPVDIIEGDGDSSLIARLRQELKLKIKKRFDKNHIIKNIGKALYELPKAKVKISKAVILHFQKCIKYIFAKHQGNAKGLEENLKALVPHQYGDHSICKPRWCGHKRAGEAGTVYKHCSLPYQVPLKDEVLKQKLTAIFEPVINRAAVYADLGSSQQNEHANKEVTHRAPKEYHFGGSESLDFRVQATAAFVNEGRAYLPQV